MFFPKNVAFKACCDNQGKMSVTFLVNSVLHEIHACFISYVFQ